MYACKQGDPTNWYCYAGLDNDSYASTIGTEGGLQELCHTMILFISLKRMGTTDCMETDRQIMRSHGMPEKGYKKDQERVSP